MNNGMNNGIMEEWKNGMNGMNISIFCESVFGFY